jgi:hypothetical protein
MWGMLSREENGEMGPRRAAFIVDEPNASGKRKKRQA